MENKQSLYISLVSFSKEILKVIVFLNNRTNAIDIVHCYVLLEELIEKVFLF